MILTLAQVQPFACKWKAENVSRSDYMPSRMILVLKSPEGGGGEFPCKSDGVPIVNNTRHILSYFFRLNTLKVTAIILTMVILDFRSLSGTSLQVFTFKKYHERPRYFYIGVPPPPPRYRAKIFFPSCKQPLTYHLLSSFERLS